MTDTNLAGTPVLVKAGTSAVTRTFPEPTTGVILYETRTEFGTPLLRVQVGRDLCYLSWDELVVDVR